MADTFDYIIVGGGTCGPIIASRLSEDPNATILVIEAGKDSEDMENMNMAGAWTLNHTGETDWGYMTPPQPGLSGRQCHLPRGRFIGGSSGCNGTICVRGVKDDYDDWGVPEWNGDEMFRAMRKAETFHPKDWFPADKPSHGYEGPLHIEPSPTGPLGELMFESYKSKGLPYHPDMFSSGETAHGCGHALRTTWQGKRTTAADYITKGYKRSNVTVWCDITADKVIIEKENGELVAKGVDYVGNLGHPGKAFARKEVVITSGTYGSPAILLRSGLGPKADLEALNIPCLVDLPGVGKNLQDHFLIFVYYELNQPDLTDDPRVNHDPNALENGRKEWRENKSGWLATFPFGAFAFARLDDRISEDNPEWAALPRQPGRDPMDLTKDQPNVEIFNTVCYGGPPEKTDFPKEGQYAFAMCTFLCGAQSRGTVKLTTKNAHANPEIDHNYLGDKRDLIMMAEGVRFANEVATQGAGTKDKIKGAWPPGSKHHLYKTNEDWQPFVAKNASTSYHPVGTCKLGKADDEMAVVDAKLRVRGVKGLRVADCSIMPTVMSGHTQMPAFGIGEKAAEILQADAGLKKAPVNGTYGTPVNGSNGVKVNGNH